MQKYLVTGGAGFIGSHLVDKLISLGKKVVILDNLSTGSIENVNKEAELIIGDVRDTLTTRELLSKNLDGCFHLAAIASVTQCRENWTEATDVNVCGTVNIFDTCAQLKIPVVYASSSAIYGEQKKLPISENATPNPISSYAVDKLACELYAKKLGLIYDTPNIGLRLFNVYGARQRPDSTYAGVITKFFNSLKANESINIFGDGTQYRDFIHVSDVVELFISALETTSTQGETVNICTGKKTHIQELVSALSDILLITPKINYLPKSSDDILYSVGCTKKMHHMLNSKKCISLAQGLSNLYEFDS